MVMKKRVAAFAGISALVLLGGCVTAPDGPTVPVMPAKGKPFAQFEREDSECQDFAESRVAGAAKRANDKAVTTAIIGTALGAGLGAAVGGGRGAAIGAASGAVVGTAIGTNDTRFRQDTLQGRYNLAYAQCMESHGNRVPDLEGDESPPRGYRQGYDDYPPPPPPPPGY
jgi:hypothetical protein